MTILIHFVFIVTSTKIALDRKLVKVKKKINRKIFANRKREIVNVKTIGKLSEKLSLSLKVFFLNTAEVRHKMKAEDYIL